MSLSVALSRVIEYESKEKFNEFSDTILGHSLGEYSALCCLDALNLKDTTSLLKKGKSYARFSYKFENKDGRSHWLRYRKG